MVSENPQHQLFVAITGGSASGKSWLADRLSEKLNPHAGRLTQDDFYKHRPHLSARERRIINFDHPRALDWALFAQVLGGLREGRSIEGPSYDFAASLRLPPQGRILLPKPIQLIDGMWLLRRRSIRRLFAVRIFVDCSSADRLQRRLHRDALERGGEAAWVEKQFKEHVEPMHGKYVEPQRDKAHLILPSPVTDDMLDHLIEILTDVRWKDHPPSRHLPEWVASPWIRAKKKRDLAESSEEEDADDDDT